SRAGRHCSQGRMGALQHPGTGRRRVHSGVSARLLDGNCAPGRRLVHHNRSMAAHLETILEPFSRSASVRSIYGDPISVNGKTIIPVARIAYGFGGGSGRKQDRSNPQEGEGGGGVY